MNISQQNSIDTIIESFFSVFDNRKGKVPDFSAFKKIFIKGAIIIKRDGNEFEIMSIEEFISPREKLLENGSLIEFNEWQIEENTFIEKGIATRICKYGKRGILNGKEFSGEGKKHFQLLLTGQGWKITSLLWEDIE